MDNFTYYNPVKIVFGRRSIAQLPRLVPAGAKILLTYGGGSIKRNGVYDQVVAALKKNPPAEFAGIEPNPRYETCMKAVERVRAEGFDFLLAIGGGSVLDGTKFIAAASVYKGKDPWDMMFNPARVPADALPIGCVMTLPATGSEMNGGAVITREATKDKLAVRSSHLFPRFSILDPETTFTLPPRQTANGVVDAFVHVMEQYLTYPADAPLQDRQAEAILLTLVEEGPKALAEPWNYVVRASLMWCATQALNGLIGCGVPQDWATHAIGHELTALYGIDHAQSLAIILPGMMQQQIDRKRNCSNTANASGASATATKTHGSTTPSSGRKSFSVPSESPLGCPTTTSPPAPSGSLPSDWKNDECRWASIRIWQKRMSRRFCLCGCD